MRRASILLLACGALAVAGCASAEDFYAPADREGPRADLSGAWLVPEPHWSAFDVEQAGERAAVRFVWYEANSGAGDVSGRVLLARATGRLEYDVVLRVLDDGRRARLVLIRDAGIPVMIATFGLVRPEAFVDTEVHRLVLGPSAAHEATRGDPAFGGGLVCQLPFAGDTPQPWPTAGSTMRPCFVSLVHAIAKGTGEIEAYRAIVPLDGGAAPWLAKFPGEGLYEDHLRRDELARARRGSAIHATHRAAIDGGDAWWVMNPVWKPDATGSSPTLLTAELYREDPAFGARPAELVRHVAQRPPGGSWSPVATYVTSASKITLVQARIENGQPVGLEVLTPDDPPIEGFLVAKEQVLSEARWRNRALVDVKNRTLPKVLGRSKTQDLRDLATRLEKLVLELNHEAELARDRAQKLVEKSSASVHEARELKKERADVDAELEDPDIRHDPKREERLTRRRAEIAAELARLEGAGHAFESQVDELREMSTIYKERIEVVKGFLPAIKEEVANRGK